MVMKCYNKIISHYPPMPSKLSHGASGCATLPEGSRRRLARYDRNYVIFINYKTARVAVMIDRSSNS